jgi:hypothetical protein
MPAEEKRSEGVSVSVQSWNFTCDGSQITCAAARLADPRQSCKYILRLRGGGTRSGGIQPAGRDLVP